MKSKETTKKNTTDLKNRTGVSSEFIQRVSAELLAIRKNKSAAS